MILRCLAVLALLLHAVACRAAAQTAGSIAGTVRDAVTGQRVPGVLVELLPSSRRVTTDHEGRFLFPSMYGGSYELHAQRAGYSTAVVRVNVADAERATVQIELGPDPIAIAAVQATAHAGGLRLSRADLEHAAARTTGEVLARFPGITVSNANGREHVSIRGSTPQAVLVLLDGVPLNDAVDGTADLSTVPVANLESVRVLPGAQSARYGPRAEAGVVLLTTRRTAFRPALGVGGGSLGTRFGTAEAGHEGDLVHVSGSATVRDRAGEFDFTMPDEAGGGAARRQNAASRTTAATASLASGKFRATLSGEHLTRGLPGRSYAPSPSARERATRVRGSAATMLQLGSASLDIAAALAHQASRLSDPRPPFGLPYSERVHAQHGQASATLLLPMDSSFLENIRATADLRGERAGATTLDADAPARYVIAGVAAGATLRHATGGGSISADADARVDYDDLRRDAVPTHVVELGYERNALRVHVAQRSSYSPPTLSDMFFRESLGVRPNPDLAPERVPFELEAGATLDTRISDIVLRTSAAAYHGSVRGLIVWAPDYRFVWSPANEDVHRWGTEASVQMLAMDERLTLSAAHSFVHLTYDDEAAPGVQVAYRPRTTVVLSAQYRSALWSARVQSRYTGRRNTAPTDANALPGFWCTDVSAARTWYAGRWRLETAANITRVFNERATLIFGYPEPGRLLELQVRLTQGKGKGQV